MSLVQPLHRLLHGRRAAGLRAHLNDDRVAETGLDEQPPLADVVRTRLLDVDVLAGVGGEDRARRVPVIRGGVPDGDDPLVVQDGPHVLHRFDAVPGVGRDPGGGLQQPGVRVADVLDLHVVASGEQFQVAGTHAAAPDEGDGRFALGGTGTGSGGERGGGDV